MHYLNLSLKDIEGEIWKDIEGYENYQISSFGRVKSLLRKVTINGGSGNGGFYYLENKIISQGITPSGYCKISLNDKNKKRRTFKTHTLVAKTFIPNIENKRTVNHKGNKNDN